MASLDVSLSARARRRPARYSPELSVQQQSSEMCTGGHLVGTPESVPLVAEQPELEEQEEGNDVEMAPATKRTRHKAKRRYKRRQTDDSIPKRPRVANVLLENEMLIDEIRERKALWMRTHEQHHSQLLTAPLWEEIAKALDTTQENIRRRWKSLKDHYRRELKKSMTDATAPPSVWPYYKKMRFMKSQMFMSLRRKNGEDHLEILSDDEEDINNQWHGQIARKQEGGSDTMDDYELAEEYSQMVKYEHLQQLTHDNTQEEEDEEEEEQQQQQQQQQQEQQQQEQEEEEEQMEEQEELSPITSLQDQEELANLQQQQNEEPVMTTDMSTMTTIAEMVGIPTIVTTTASSLEQRDQRAEEPELEDMDARHSAIQQQRAQINGRISAIQRNVQMNVIQQRANITALHERAEMTAMHQRARMQQRNGNVGNGDDSNVSPIIGDDRGGISDDYHFFMSLMPHVRHFTSLQKLKVRNRIQQIIIEEASSCPYDPLGNC